LGDRDISWEMLTFFRETPKMVVQKFRQKFPPVSEVLDPLVPDNLFLVVDYKFWISPPISLKLCLPPPTFTNFSISPVFVNLRVFYILCVYFVCPPLRWSWCIYASHNARSGRPWILRWLGLVIKVSAYVCIGILRDDRPPDETSFCWLVRKSLITCLRLSSALSCHIQIIIWLGSLSSFQRLIFDSLRFRFPKNMCISSLFVIFILDPVLSLSDHVNSDSGSCFYCLGPRQLRLICQSCSLHAIKILAHALICARVDYVICNAVYMHVGLSWKNYI